jgi:uncharacterized protein with HEPN domain
MRRLGQARLKNCSKRNADLAESLVEEAIAGMRDLLVHVYWNTNLNLVWQVIQEDLPPLKQVVMQILAEQTDL